MSFPTGGTPTTAPLPTGAATAARQDTGNASLSSLDSVTSTRLAPIGARDAFARWRGTAIMGGLGVSDTKNSGQIRIASPTGYNLGSSIAGVSDQVWLCASRLTGTTEDFYASMVTGEVP